MINHVNMEIFELCSYYHQFRFIQHQEFAVNHEMNKELFLKDMIHTSNNGLRQLATDFIKHKISEILFFLFINYFFFFMLFVDTLLTALLITYFIFVKHPKS